MSESSFDRRALPRRNFKTLALCQRGENGLGEIVTGHLLDVSTGGASLLVRYHFKEGEVFYLAFVNSQRETIADCRSTVRWQRNEAPGVFRMGVMFDQPLTDEEVANIR